MSLLEDISAALQKGKAKDYTIARTAQGMTIQADGPEDHRLALEMVKAMGSKISSMETIVALLENYKNVYIGFEFSRQAGENAK